MPVQLNSYGTDGHGAIVEDIHEIILDVQSIKPVNAKTGGDPEKPFFILNDIECLLTIDPLGGADVCDTLRR
jgi:hypothetical protein